MGITMVLIGISAYRDFAPFVANVTDGLGFVSAFATVWAYLLPALLIFGGIFLSIGRYGYISVLTAGTALASVPIGLMLKNTITGLPLPDMMAAAYPSMVWIIAFYLAVNRMPEWETTVSESEEK
ncbi:MAG: hypothetical protein ABL890_02300 [Candidatus Peribacteraceae bacterium]